MKHFVVSAPGGNFIASFKWSSVNGRTTFQSEETSDIVKALRYSEKSAAMVCECMGAGLKPMPFVEKQPEVLPGYAVRLSDTSLSNSDTPEYLFVGTEDQCRAFSRQERIRQQTDPTPGPRPISHRVVRINVHRPNSMAAAMAVLSRQRRAGGETISSWHEDKYLCGDWWSADGTNWFHPDGSDADRFNLVTVTLSGGPRDKEVVA